MQTLVTDFVNFNKHLLPENEVVISFNTDAFQGNIVQQKFLILENKIFFLEESYFNLMASMRKLRIKIPLQYTLEFFEKQILDTLLSHQKKNSTATVFCFPNQNEVNFIISLKEFDVIFSKKDHFEVDIFKEIPIVPTYINVQPVYHIENIIANKYAEENDLQDVIFLTHEKKISRTTLGNLYCISEKKVIAMPTKDGIYKQAIDFEFQKFIDALPDFELTIQSLSPFETQKMDELFILEEGRGVHSISKIRQKTFRSSITQGLILDFIHSL